MFKKSFLLVALLVTGLASATAAELKIGVVDMRAVAEKMPQDNLINEQSRKDLQERQDGLKALQKKAKDLREQAQRDQMTLTNQQKLKIDRELKAIETEFNLKSQFLKEDANIVSQQTQNAMLGKIKVALDKVAADEKLDMVLTRETVVFVGARVDITDKVIKVLTDPAG